MNLSLATAEEVENLASSNTQNYAGRFQELTMPAGLTRIHPHYQQLQVSRLDAGYFGGDLLDFTDASLRHLRIRGPHVRTIRVNPQATIEIPEEHHFTKIVVERVDPKTGKVLRTHIPNNHSYRQPVRPEDAFASLNGKVLGKHGEPFRCDSFSAKQDENHTDDENDETPGALGLRNNMAKRQKEVFGSPAAVQASMNEWHVKRYHLLHRTSENYSVFEATQMGKALYSAFAKMNETDCRTYLFTTDKHSMTALLKREKDADGRLINHVLVWDCNAGPRTIQRQTDNLEDVKNWQASDFMPPRHYNQYFSRLPFASLTQTPRGPQKVDLIGSRFDENAGRSQPNIYVGQSGRLCGSLLHFFEKAGHDYSPLLPELLKLSIHDLLRQVNRNFVSNAMFRENEQIITHHFSLLQTLAQAGKLNSDQIAYIALRGEHKAPDGQLIPSIADAIGKDDSASIKKYSDGIRSFVEAKVLRPEDMAKFAPLWNAQTMALVQATLGDKNSPNRSAALAYEELVRNVQGTHPPQSSKETILRTRF